jgi:hypothetical protein
MLDVNKVIHPSIAFKPDSSRLVDRKAEIGYFDRVASIRRGLAQAREGAGRIADEVFEELEREDSTR